MNKMLTMVFTIFSSILLADVSVWVCNATPVSGQVILGDFLFVQIRNLTLQVINLV